MTRRIPTVYTAAGTDTGPCLAPRKAFNNARCVSLGESEGIAR